ncbi:MAG: response regulator [Hyphomicrobiales bacterium]|nr:response regulator [Hyphomicrobiales bacterium]
MTYWAASYQLEIAHMRALVVSPSQGERSLFGTILRNIGVRRIADASDGIEALDCLRSANYGVAVIDNKIDGGYNSFASCLTRCRDGGLIVPALILTSDRPTMGIVERAIAAGFTTVLAKPFAARDLLRHIVHSLARNERSSLRSIAVPPVKEQSSQPQPAERPPPMRDRSSPVRLPNGDFILL